MSTLTATREPGVFTDGRGGLFVDDATWDRWERELAARAKASRESARRRDLRDVPRLAEKPDLAVTVASLESALHELSGESEQLRFELGVADYVVLTSMPSVSARARVVPIGDTRRLAVAA